jgi:hypothetical protein
MRIILGVPYRTHINDMLRELNVMDVKSRVAYANGCMMYKFQVSSFKFSLFVIIIIQRK